MFNYPKFPQPLNALQHAGHQAQLAFWRASIQVNRALRRGWLGIEPYRRWWWLPVTSYVVGAALGWYWLSLR